MPNADGDESDVCARCAKHGGTCCTLACGQEDLCFPLSTVERVGMEHAGARPHNFTPQVNTAGFLDNLCRLFPSEVKTICALFPPGKEHDRLSILQNGACSLLGASGCSLPRLARPLYCRLFPFWIKNGQELYFEFAQCQAQRESRGGASLRRSLSMTSEHIRRTYKELRRAWGLPEQK